ARKAVQDAAACRLRYTLEGVAEGLSPFLDDHQVALEHAAGLAELVHVGVIDEGAVDVDGAVAGGKRVRRAKNFRLASQVDHDVDAVGLHRLATWLGEMAQVVRSDQDSRTGDATRARQTTQVARVLAVGPVEPTGRLF